MHLKQFFLLLAYLLISGLFCQEKFLIKTHPAYRRRGPTISQLTSLIQKNTNLVNGLPLNIGCLRSSSNRAPNWYLGGHGFESCRRLRYFLCPTLVDIYHIFAEQNIFHFSMKSAKKQIFQGTDPSPNAVHCFVFCL